MDRGGLDSCSSDSGVLGRVGLDRVLVPRYTPHEMIALVSGLVTWLGLGLGLGLGVGLGVWLG